MDFNVYITDIKTKKAVEWLGLHEAETEDFVEFIEQMENEYAHELGQYEGCEITLTKADCYKTWL